MARSHRRFARIALVVACVLLIVLGGGGALLAQGGYSAWFESFDGGGGSAIGGGYSLTGAMGQPDAGKVGLGPYILNSGVLVTVGGGGSLPTETNKVFLPLARR